MAAIGLKVKRFFTWLLLGLLAVIVTAYVALSSPDADKADVIAKYSNAESDFITDGDGHDIHFRDQGNPDGPAIILLHGSNASLHTWERMVEILKDDFRLISLDLPGHGLSGPDPKRDYSAASMVGAVGTVMDAAGVERAVIAGNSMGGWVSWRFALANPERTAGLVLIDSAGAETDEKIEPYLAAKIMQSKFGRFLTPRITPKAIIRKTLTQVVYDDAQITDAMVARYYDLAHFPGTRDAMNDRATTPREVGMFSKVDQISVPTLILWGKHDVTIPVSHGQAFNAKIPNSELIVYPNAAHLLMEEIPMTVANDIRAWHQTSFEPPAN